MVVAITGGTGFIGRKLVLQHLARGDEVRVLSRRNPERSGLLDSVLWCAGDLEQQKNLQSFADGVDVLYHCAGEIRDTARMEAVHVGGTSRLINAASGRIGRWVQLSSAGAYGQRREGIVTEETSLNPEGAYEVTKVQSDLLVSEAATKGAFQHVVLRPSIVYGTEMTNRSLFSLIAMIQRGWFFFIGKPGTSANYIHVDNVAKALLLCGTAPHANNQIYNLSDYQSLENFVGIISHALGRELPHLRLPELPVRALVKVLGWVPGMSLTESRINALTNHTVYPNTKIEQELDYRHMISMEDGLAQLVAFWQSNLAQR